ncbi:hypothetical protein ACWDSL_10815 [Streptomyces sp. NPDC000941]
MRFPDEHDFRAVFDLDTAIASRRAAFVALARGEAWQPEKILGGHPDDPDTVFCYAAHLDRTTGPVCTFGSVNPGNAGTSRPTINAVVAVLASHTDVPLTFLEGTALTMLRTAAASAVAVGALARKDAARLLALGPAFRGGRTGRAATSLSTMNRRRDRAAVRSSGPGRRPARRSWESSNSAVSSSETWPVATAKTTW